MIVINNLRRRLLIVLTVAMCAAVIGGIARTAILPDRAELSLSPKVWYRLDSQAGKAVCQLPANGSRYTLVIGCLADASESHVVRLRVSNESDRYSRLKIVEQAARLHVINSEVTGEPPVLRMTQQAGEISTTDVLRSKLVSTLGTTRDFYLHVTDGELNDPKQYARMTAQCVGEGERVRVFVDQQLGTYGVRDSQVADLIQLLETDVLPRVEAQYGPLCDVDLDGRFAVVLSPWLGRLQGGRVSINGMVRSSDFQRAVEQPLGNRCDMLLLNSSLPCGAALRDLLSHEVAHAACISQRVQHLPLKSADEQDWVSEGLAHLAEPTGTNSAERIATFLDDPSRHPLVVPDYYRAGLWRDPGCRGATVLFSKWCVETYGPGFCGRLAQSTKSGTRSFEQATSLPFENLFRQWSLSLAEGQQFQSLNLCGRVGGQQLAGIRRHHWDARSGDLSLPIRGTAIAVVELQSNASPAMTICIEGDSTACWQFSIQRIPAN